MLLDNPFRPDLRVLREAQTLAESGYDVTIYAWDRDTATTRLPQECFGDNVQVIRISVKSDQQLGLRQIPYYLAYAHRAFWKVWRQDYDIVHCHDLTNLPIGILLKLFKGIDLVYDAHEIYWIMEGTKYSKLILTLLQFLEIVLLRSIDVFITVGEVRAKYYRRYYERKIHVVGNWYDPKMRDSNAGEELRKNLGIPREAFVVTYAGTLSLVRATDVLVESIQSWNDSRIHWIVCGYGSAEECVKSAAEKNSNLHFLGWLEDITPVFSASDALIYLMDLSHPYAFYNAPNTLYLAIAWKLPLIAISTGEIAEVLTSGKTGLLIESVGMHSISDAVRELAFKSGLYGKIVQELGNLQPQYSWKRAKVRLLSAYEEIADN